MSNLALDIATRLCDRIEPLSSLKGRSRLDTIESIAREIDTFAMVEGVSDLEDDEED
jgi:hypothetical protein